MVRTVRYGPDDIFPRWQFDPRYFERLVIRQSVQLLKVHEKKHAYYDCVLYSSIDKFDWIWYSMDKHICTQWRVEEQSKEICRYLFGTTFRDT